MADIQDLLALIPSGSKYQMLIDALVRVNATFPEQMAEITAARVQGWVNEITSGQPSAATNYAPARDATQIRNDIFKYIVGEDVIMERLGVSREEAQALINMTGGAQFATNPQVANQGTPNAAAPLTILYGQKQQWYFDPRTNKYYVAYGMPNSDTYMFFEVEDDQLVALFGEGNKPNNVINTTVAELAGRPNYYFAGNVAEMAGTGSFEQQYERIIATALDTTGLPDWMLEDQAAMDIVLVGQLEGKTNDWIIEQISKLPSFKARFPGLEAFKSLNMTTAQAVTAFLEYESSLKTLARQFGQDEATITPELVGALVTKGYSIEDVGFTYKTFKRMEEYAPALAAFNEVLVANGMNPLTPEDQYQFLSGNAPQEIYDIYESSSFREEAVAAGLGDALTASEAIDLALATPGMTNQQQIAAGMREAAQFALRLRSQLDLGQFGLNIDDIIDLSLGVNPRSGVELSQVQQQLTRAIQQGKAFTETQRATPFSRFTTSGVPQQASLSTLRQER